jgi:hypothetical protein
MEVCVGIEEKTYLRIKAARDKDPDLNIKEYCAKYDLSPGYYYKLRRRNEPKKAPKAVKYEQLAPSTPQQLMLIMGSPDQIREFIGGQT